MLKKNIPNAITCLVVASGCALMVGSSIPVCKPWYCLLAVCIGLLADVLAARYLEACSSFGCAFDQLADLTCFGIGPAVFFVRMQLDGKPGFSTREVTCLLAGLAYMICSVARIARELVQHKMRRPTHFIGIPTNLACPVVVMAAFLAPHEVWLPWLVAGLSYLMISNRRIDKDIGLRRYLGIDPFGLGPIDPADESKTSDPGELVPRFPDGPFAQVPNAITCCVVASGFALMLGSSIPIARPWYCLVTVFVGLLADVLDGMTARKLNVCSKFGSAFDQLADLTCFGIAPAVFFMRMQLDGQAGFSSREWRCLCAGLVYMACSAMRIARELVATNMTRPKHFIGIPTNLACPMVVLSVYMFPHAEWLPVLVLNLSCLMISKFHIDKDLGMRRAFKLDPFGLGPLH